MKYLRLQGWENKIFSVPHIPRNKNFVESLYTYLEQAENNRLENKIALRLMTSGFLFKDKRDNWKLTDISKELLSTKDENNLFKYINNTVIFFGEILFLLEQERLNIGALLTIANEEYSIINWKRKNQISNRLQWLTDLGLVEYISFENLYHLTEMGKAYLKEIEHNFGSLKINEDKTIEYTELINNIPNWIWEIENKDMNRFGYLAGGNKQYFEVIKKTILLVQEGENDITNYTNNLALSNLKEKTAKQYTKTLIDLELLKQQSQTTYEVTNLGDKVILLDNFQFIFYLDRFYTFVLEILPYLDEKPLTKKELMMISKEKYSICDDSMRKRLGFLEKANLVFKVDYYTYSITALGKTIMIEFNIEKFINNKLSEKDISTGGLGTVEILDPLIIELRQAASDSMNYSRFEQAINACFIQLGYDSEWLGKSGETDVLIRTNNAPVSQYKIIVDAKSTTSPTVSANMIDFPVLEEHKRDNEADYIVVVGKKFNAGKLVKRAEEYGAVLLDVDTLSILLKNHSEIPLGYKEYEKIFSEGGIVNSDILNEDRDYLIYRKKLIYTILNILTEFTGKIDENIEGVLSPRDLYIILMSGNKLTPIPTLNQIEGVLEFLSLPFIQGVKKVKGGYSIKSSVSEISNRLNFLSK